MNLRRYDFFRLCSFSLLTAMEILLAIFLLSYGSETLKPFAVLLLVVQLFSLHKIYVFSANILVSFRN